MFVSNPTPAVSCEYSSEKFGRKWALTGNPKISVNSPKVSEESQTFKKQINIGNIL